MAKVSELKDRARELEQQGELAKAQAIYQHILKHLEGSPALNAELPLYVKVGDLALKQGDARTAIAMYDRAAEHYARAGSARSITALAEKIRRADPTKDDAAIMLGKALLAEGHAVAAAEVMTRYLTRTGRTDVADVLAGVAAEPSAEAARARVERGLILLATAPDEPTAGAGPEEEAPPGVPEQPEERAPTPSAPAVVTSSMADTLGGLEVAPPAEPPAKAPSDLPFLIEYGAPQPEVSPSREPPLGPEPEAVAEPEPEREPEPEPEPVSERRPEPPAWPEPAARPAAWPEPEPEEEPEPEPEPEPVPPSRFELEQEQEAEVHAAAPPERAREPEPSRRSPEDVEPHVLVRQPRAGARRPNQALAAGIGIVVVVGGLGAAWALGWLPFGGGASPSDGEPTTTIPVPAVGDSAAHVADSATAADTVVVQDTAAFGPIGFNAVVDSPVVSRPAADTAVRRDSAVAVGPPAGPDTVPTPVLPPAGPLPRVAAPVLPTVVVPPGHAVADEIVVIPGLEVLSVAETRAGGALGHRVVQQAEVGIEVRLVATPGNFGADTVGLGEVQVQLEADTAVGSVRIGRYLVDARAPMPVEMLTAYLRQLIRARPVN